MELFAIARRLFGQREQSSRISRPAVTIAVWGVAVGLAVMILSVGIILGFKGEISRKVEGFGGHVQVINYESLFSAESQPVAADGLFMHRLGRIPGVGHVQRFCTKSGMLKTDRAFKGIVLRGVGPEYDTAFLAAHLAEGRLPAFSDSLVSNEILISRSVASELGLAAGQKVFAYFFAENVKARRYTVAGIYETHLKEFDSNLVFTDLSAVQKLAGWDPAQCSGVELITTDFGQLDAVTSRVTAAVNRTQDAYGATYSAHSVRQLYPSIFSWLALLDTNIYLILALMTGLSVFTMASGLLIIILERTPFIAVMKSVGATDGQLRRIFLHFAAMLVVRGLVWGNVLGIGLSVVQRRLGLVHLDPSTYYVDAMPLEISWPLIGLLNVGTLLIILLALLLPSHLVARIEPARVMRFE